MMRIVVLAHLRQGTLLVLQLSGADDIAGHMQVALHAHRAVIG